MLIPLSTRCFPWSNAPPECDHKHMVDKRAPMPRPGDRLDYVMKVCRVPSKAEFARWIKSRSPQRVGNWWGRAAIPAEAAKLIRSASGASYTWLMMDEGEPFPDGPTMYAPPSAAELDKRLSDLEDEFGDLGTAIARMIRVISAKLPGTAAALEEALQSLPAQQGSRSPALEVVAAAAAEAREAEEQAARAVAPTGSSGKPQRSGRSAG
jgi:hypothetical protein